MADFLKKLFLENWQYKLGAFITALVLWFYVASEQNLSVVINAPVQFDNFPSDMSIINKVANSADIELTGRRDIVNNINKKEVKVIINLKGSKEGKNNYRITPLNIKSIPRGLEIRNVTPYQIEIELQQSKAQAGK
jgi:YbbR domain-containing protein